MKKIGLIFFILLLAIGAHAEEKKPLPGQASEQAKFVLETVWERKLDEDVTDVLLATVEERPSHKIPVVAGIVKKAGVEFLDRTGKLKKKVDFGGGKMDRWLTIKSDNGEYLGLREGPASYYGMNAGPFTMFNNKGEVLYKKEAGSHFIFPSPDGQYAVGIFDPEFPNAPLEFIPREGNPTLIEDLPRHSSLSEPSFTDSGDYFCVSISGRKYKQPPFVIVYDRNGKEIWRRELVGSNSAGGRKISNKGNYIAALGSFSEGTFETFKMYIYLFGSKGDLLWKKSISGTFRGFYFSEDGKFLAVIGGQRLKFMETETGKILWEFETSIPDHSFDGVYIASEADLIFLTAFDYSFPSHKGDYIRVLNMWSGRLLFEKKFGEPVFVRSHLASSYKPTVWVSSRGDMFFFVTKRGLEKIKINKKIDRQ